MANASTLIDLIAESSTVELSTIMLLEKIEHNLKEQAFRNCWKFMRKGKHKYVAYLMKEKYHLENFQLNHLKYSWTSSI